MVIKTTGCVDLFVFSFSSMEYTEIEKKFNLRMRHFFNNWPDQKQNKNKLKILVLKLYYFRTFKYLTKTALLPLNKYEWPNVI